MLEKFTVVPEDVIVYKGETKKNESKKYSLDEAIRLTENGRFHTMIIILSGIVLMGATIESLNGSIILPNANCDLHFSTAEFAMFGSIPFLGFVLSSHLWGLLADTWGRRNVIRLTATFSFITSFISSLLTNITMLILFRFLVGFFISGLKSSVFSYASEFHTKEKASKSAAMVSTFMPTIFTYAAVIGILIIPMNWSLDLYFVTFVPWRLFMIIMSLINLVNAIAFCFLPETPKFLMEMNRIDECLAVLRKMYAINTGLPEDAYPVLMLKNEVTTDRLVATKGFVNLMKLVWNQTIPIFMKPHLDTTIKLCYTIFVLFAIDGLFIWFPDFLVQLQIESNYGKSLCAAVSQRNVNAINAGGCNVNRENVTTFKIYFVIGIIYTTLAGIISFYLDKIGPRILFPLWLILSAGCSISLVFLTEFYSIQIAIVTFLSGSLCAAIIGGISANLYPTKIRAMATCFIFMFGRFGGLVGGNLIGIFLENSCSSIFYVFGGLTLSCVLVFCLVKKQAHEENDVK